MLYFPLAVALTVILLVLAGVQVGRTFTRFGQNPLQAWFLAAIVGAAIGVNSGVLIEIGAERLDLLSRPIELKRFALIMALGGAGAGFCGGMLGSRREE